MSEKIIPMHADDGEGEQETPDVPPTPRPRSHIIYRYAPPGDDPEAEPTYCFDDELIEPRSDLPACTNAGDWTPVAIVKMPQMIRDAYGTMRYTFPDGAAYSASDIVNIHEDLQEVVLDPIV